jgi:hypothetical protein
MKTPLVVIFSLITGLSLTTLSHAAGEIYRFKNSQGNTVYTDRKPNSDYEVIKGGNKISNAQTTETNESISATVVTRSVDDVRAVTDTLKPDIDSLYTKLVTSDQDSRGKVTVNFTIAQTGNVTSCAEDETEMNGAKFNGSICEKINALQFKAVENPDPLRLTFTYNFKPAS